MVGNTAASAPQIPRCPSPTTSRGGRRPRRLRSRSNAPQLSVDSRWPLSTARMTFRPSRSPARTTRMAALSFSSPALTYTPSTQRQTGSRSASDRLFQRSYSACQPAFSRAIDAADSGAPSPSSPRRARSKSPVASPCRYSVGSNWPTASVRRLNSGRSWLSNRSANPRTRGRRSVIVPALRLSRRGFP